MIRISIDRRSLLNPSASEEMYRSCALGDSAVVRSSLWNEKFVACVEDVLFAVEDLNIFACNTDHVFIELVNVGL